MKIQTKIKKEFKRQQQYYSFTSGSNNHFYLKSMYMAKRVNRATFLSTTIDFIRLNRHLLELHEK